MCRTLTCVNLYRALYRHCSLHSVCVYTGHVLDHLTMYYHYRNWDYIHTVCLL